MDLYAIIEEYLQAGKGGTMATIVKKLGAAPREEGAKMFVGSDGKFYGTIGGGCVEAEVWQEAMRVGKSGQAKLLHYRMDGRLVEDEGMICGGNIDIFLEPVAEGQRGVYDAIRRLEREGKSGLIVTRFGEAGFLKGLVHQDGTTEGDNVDPSIPENFEGYLAQKRPVVEGETVVEPVLFPSMLYIFRRRPRIPVRLADSGHVRLRRDGDRRPGRFCQQGALPRGVRRDGGGFHGGVRRAFVDRA